MRIIISPAKKMRIDLSILPESVPEYLDKAQLLLNQLRALSREELKKVWACSDILTEENIVNLRRMDLSLGRTPAIMAYDGIQYQYMAPETFTASMMDYVQKNLRILSGFYGVLSPLDGVVPYRLEMQARLQIGGAENLYVFWGSCLYQSVRSEDGIIINIASNEYSRAVKQYLCPGDRMITCVFGEIIGDKIVQKGVYAKMARGGMVRFLAQTGTVFPEQMKEFCMFGYRYCPSCSDETEYVFLKQSESEVKKTHPVFEWTES